MTGRRFQYEMAKRHGDEMDVFVKEKTGSWQNPVITPAAVAEEFEIDEEEVIKRLRESTRTMYKEIEPGVFVFW